MLQETEYEQKCRTLFTQSCNTVYDIRQECSTKYVEVCDNIPNPVKTSRNLSRWVQDIVVNRWMRS